MWKEEDKGSQVNGGLNIDFKQVNANDCLSFTSFLH